MKILCLDDSGLFRRTLRKQLQTLGIWDFKECESAAQAASELEVDPSISLVLADFHIASGTGLDLLQWIRAHQDTRIRTLPFMLVTGETDRGLVVAAAQHGIQGFLLKPLSITALSTKLKQVMGDAMPA